MKKKYNGLKMVVVVVNMKKSVNDMVIDQRVIID